MKRIIIFSLFSFLLFSSLGFAQNEFTIELNLPDSYRSVSAGDEIWFTTKLINLGNQERTDITLTYDILDLNNNSIVSKSQTLAVQTQASFVGHILLPEGLDLGKYALKVVVTPIGLSLGSESQITFDVVAEKTDTRKSQDIYLLLGFLSGIGILVYAIIKSKPLFRRFLIRMQVHRIIMKKK